MEGEIKNEIVKKRKRIIYKNFMIILRVKVKMSLIVI